MDLKLSSMASYQTESGRNTSLRKESSLLDAMDVVGVRSNQRWLEWDL